MKKLLFAFCLIAAFGCKSKEENVQDVEQEKIEATEEIADAEREVDEEKIEATKEITEAEQDAGAGGSYTKGSPTPAN